MSLSRDFAVSIAICEKQTNMESSPWQELHAITITLMITQIF